MEPPWWDELEDASSETNGSSSGWGPGVAYSSSDPWEDLDVGRLRPSREATEADEDRFDPCPTPGEDDQKQSLSTRGECWTWATNDELALIKLGGAW